MLKISLVMFGLLVGLVASPIASAHDLQDAGFVERMLHLVVGFDHLPSLLAIGFGVVLAIRLIFIGIDRAQVWRSR